MYAVVIDRGSRYFYAEVNIPSLYYAELSAKAWSERVVAADVFIVRTGD